MLLVLLRPEIDVDRLAAPLGRRVDDGLVHLPERALREGREDADLFDLVAEQLDAQRLAARGAEDVDEPAAHCELPALLDPLDALVAGRRQLLDQRVEPGLVAANDSKRRGPERDRRQALRHRCGRCADEPASLEHLERPRSLADEMRRRLEPGAEVDAARREERDCVLAEEPPGRLGRVACIGVLGKKDDEATVELHVERREDEWEDRLRHAGALRECRGVVLEPRLGTQAIDERRRGSWGRRWSIDPPLRCLEAFGVERLDRIGGPLHHRLRVVVGGEVGQHPVGERAGIAALRPPHSDAKPQEVGPTESRRDRTKAVVPGEPSAPAQLEPPGVEIALVVHDEHLVRLELEEPRGGLDGAPRVVHVRLGLQQTRPCGRRSGSRPAGR